ncbi:hypothetical protein FH603_3416 [Spirosoma sp. LMG 31447]|uniref:Transposase n=1 Tax=Spirosoma utsteinense TaxID=2585773 RepID=A0ABR6W8K1_9BACT|nr:hypothetical protein [Spirosoma utsteinense]
MADCLVLTAHLVLPENGSPITGKHKGYSASSGTLYVYQYCDRIDEQIGS